MTLLILLTLAFLTMGSIGARPAVYGNSLGSPGLISGVFGCIFGLLGIFTIGFVFVPFAVLCGLAGGWGDAGSQASVFQ